MSQLSSYPTWRRGGRGVALPLWLLGVAALLSGCGPTYSPNTYSAAAVQQANKVDQGVVVGVRPVDISSQTNVGTLAGGGVGGIAGSAVGDNFGIGSALGALTGSIVGGIVGSAAEHQSSDTKGWEYIVRKPNAELISVTQKDEKPLELGQRVLIIAGNQARIVPDYTVELDSERPAARAEEAPRVEAQNPPPLAITPEPAVVPEPAPTPEQPAANGPAAPSDMPESAPLLP